MFARLPIGRARPPARSHAEPPSRPADQPATHPPLRPAASHRPARHRAAICALVCSAALTGSLLPGTAATAGAAAPWPPAPALHAPYGPTFLPNLDDDQRRCTLRPGDLDRLDVAVDRRLAACNDAANDVVDGPADVKDLAPLRTDPLRVSDGATGTVTVPAGQQRFVRLFVERGGKLVVLRFGERLRAEELRAGVRLAIEGRDIVRDPARWDGGITLTLSVTDGGATGHDRLRMRVAPVLLQHDLQRAQHVFAAAPGPGAGIPTEIPISDRRPGQWRAFADTLRTATRAAGLPDRALRFTAGTDQWWRDMWRQDVAEPGYAVLPTPGGGQHTMRLLLRSPNHWTSADGRAASLRRSGRLLYRDLRGPDVGVVQQYTTDRDASVDELLNYTGNVEALPPYAGYPNGRIVYGATAARRPDPSFTRMLHAQAQPPVVLDTSWLLVGHVDETFHVVRADNARGWTLAVSDPRLAVRLLRRAQQAGAGGGRLFTGTEVPGRDRPTVDELLASAALRAANEDVARRIDRQVGTLLAATGLRADELITLPVLYGKMRLAPDQPHRAYALTPALANGLSLTARDFAAPVPHGPKVAGVDLFQRETERRLAANGVRVRWVENFSWAHLGGGEVHCATNALREVTPRRAAHPAPPRH